MEFLSKLKITTTSDEIKTIVKNIADVAQTDVGREICTQIDLVKHLTNLLQENDTDILIQTCRALGNICYENLSGCKMLQEMNGLECIFKVLNYGIDLKETGEYLRNVAAGFLLNYLVDQQDQQQKALEQGIISILCNILEINGPNAAMDSLLILEILNESGIQFLDERLTKIFINILTNNSALTEMCLEILHGQAENENAKMIMAKSGICELLLKQLEENVSNEACNLIVVIITGDKSMNLLYDNGKGSVYKKLVEWLECDVDINLQIAAVLAMGNFARTDAHCQLMVTEGVHKMLFELLKKNSTIDSDVRFQHALLSAIRNLVIPINNKPIMLADGLIDVVYPILNIPTYPVVFKFLGTLRIVVDNQQDAACILGQKDDLIKQTLEWCNTEAHLGVQGEANRLIAWLIINSRNQNVCSKLINYGAIKYLVKMINGPHPLMQNEALTSLTITTAISLKASEPDLIESNIGQVLETFFQTYAPTLQLPIIENAITFITTIIKSDVLKEHIKSSNIPKLLLECPDESEDWRNLLQNKIKALTNLLKD